MKDRIAVNPSVRFGKPCVAGTRIPVQSVLELVREGLGFDQIIRDFYPDLKPDDIRACVQYAIDVIAVEHPARINTPVRFLADQDVYALTIAFLRGLGHDVVAAAALACRGPTMPSYSASRTTSTHLRHARPRLRRPRVRPAQRPGVTNLPDALRRSGSARVVRRQRAGPSPRAEADPMIEVLS